MTEPRSFQRGDVVVHRRRQEWGDGVVQRATRITHDGKSAQRLVVNFKHHGRVTINTGVAPLMTKGVFATMSSSSPSGLQSETVSTGGWLGSLTDQSQQDGQLWQLFHAMTDPFQSIGSRLQTTLDSYRFSTEARSLIDWAIAQTGLEDPLSKFTRHELELAYARFARDRDLHLRSLVRELKKQGQANLLDKSMREAHFPGARQALLRAIKA